MNLTKFVPDPDRFEVLRECTESYGVGTPDAEWPNNLLSRKTIVYGSGVIAREGDNVLHNVDPRELALCKKLADDAYKSVGNSNYGMGDEGSNSGFSPFFICSNANAENPIAITESLIRARFGGTIFPLATITAEPLKESGIWWNEVVDWIADYESKEQARYLKSWRRLIGWFNSHADLTNAAFIRIGDWAELLAIDELPEGTELTGCVFPRLAVALTTQGSLVGLFGYVVQT